MKFLLYWRLIFRNLQRKHLVLFYFFESKHTGDLRYQKEAYSGKMGNRQVLSRPSVVCIPVSRECLEELSPSLPWVCPGRWCLLPHWSCSPGSCFTQAPSFDSERTGVTADIILTSVARKGNCALFLGMPLVSSWGSGPESLLWALGFSNPCRLLTVVGRKAWLFKVTWHPKRSSRARFEVSWCQWPCVI